MKYYTTIEQSKKLLELGMSPESADMLYTWDIDNKTYYPLPIIDDKEHDFPSGLSCWSVGALLELVPIDELWTENRDGSTKYCIIHSWYQSEWYDTIIEAAIDMIEQLH